MTEDLLETLPPPVLFDDENRISEPFTLELSRPVTHGSQELHEIEFQPLRALHVRQLGTDFEAMDALLQIAGKLSGLPDGVLDQLSATDIGRVAGAVQGLLWPAVDLPNVGRDEDGEVRIVELPRLVQPFELKLSKPLKVGERDEVSSITFHEVTGKVARTFPSGQLPVSKLPKMIEKLTRLPGDAVDRLSGIDLRNALGVAQCFFASIRATGRGSGAF